MKKEELKKRLEEVVTQLRDNSKDVHSFDGMIDRVLSLKGQIDTEPMLAYVKEEDVVNRIEGTTFEMAYTKTKSVYRLKGGLTIIADNSLGLGGQIMDYVDTMKDESSIPEDKKELFSMDMHTSMFIYNAPLFAANDVDFRYKLGQLIIDYLNEWTNKMNEVKLPEETEEKDREFFATLKAAEILDKASK